MTELFDRLNTPKHQEATVLVSVELNKKYPQHSSQIELLELSKAVDADILGSFEVKRQDPESKYFIGTGQAESLKALVERLEASLVIFNHSLTPSQEKNLSRLLNCRVIDRIRLILDIFALRAKTHEGCLQVELAQLNYLSTRLVRGWTHLERQRGGIGLRGPGETQLEIDHRLIAVRIKSLNRQLEKVKRQRQLGRSARKRNRIPCIALVGYTNAGKSTLFNRLCQTNIFATDLLFATLDTTIRKVKVPGMGECLLIDTVGFIQQLPHQLIAAFRATLEEVANADLLLHVIDGSDDSYDSKIAAVLSTLETLQANDIPRIDLINKIDAVSNEQALIFNKQDLVPHISAEKSIGLQELLAFIAQKMRGEYKTFSLILSGNYSKLYAFLHHLGNVLCEDFLADGRVEIQIELCLDAFKKIRSDKSIVSCEELSA